MGLAIVIPGVDFSSKNLGQVTYSNIPVTGISISTQRTENTIVASASFTPSGASSRYKLLTWNITDASSVIDTQVVSSDTSQITITLKPSANNATLVFTATNSSGISGSATMNNVSFFKDYWELGGNIAKIPFGLTLDSTKNSYMYVEFKEPLVRADATLRTGNEAKLLISTITDNEPPLTAVTLNRSVGLRIDAMGVWNNYDQSSVNDAGIGYNGGKISYVNGRGGANGATSTKSATQGALYFNVRTNNDGRVPNSQDVINATTVSELNTWAQSNAVVQSSVKIKRIIIAQLDTVYSSITDFKAACDASIASTGTSIAQIDICTVDSNPVNLGSNRETLLASNL